MFSTLLETRRQVEIEIREVLESDLKPETLNVLFDFLSRFIHFPNLCPLEGAVEAQMEKIFEIAYIAQGNLMQDSNPVWKSCLVNVSRSFIQPYKQAMMPHVERQLADIALFVDALNTFRHMMKVVRDHSFSPTCIATATRLKYCAYCGGYKVFKPCVFLCMNTFRGCAADIAELHPTYTTFVTALRMFSRQLSSELEPKSLIRNCFGQLVTLARDLSRTSLTERVSTEI